MTSAVALARALGAAANACPFCFSNASSDPRFTHAITWLIGLLFLTTFSILGTLVYAVVRLERRKALADSSAQGGGRPA